MIASIRDKEAWLLEREDMIAEFVYMRSFVDLPEKTQAVVRRKAEFNYADTMEQLRRKQG